MANTKAIILDPALLEVVAFICITDSRKAGDIALMLRDVRELALDCVIINSDEDLVELDEIVRLRGLKAENFQLVGKKVVSDMGRRLGNVEDYTLNIETNRIQKLYVSQSIIRSFFGSSLIIDRTQIIDVTPRQIVVKDATLKAGVLTGDIVPETNP